jgi:hypothetical protein
MVPQDPPIVNENPMKAGKSVQWSYVIRKTYRELQLIRMNSPVMEHPSFLTSRSGFFALHENAVQK